MVFTTSTGEQTITLGRTVLLQHNHILIRPTEMCAESVRLGASFPRFDLP